ncbi:MAG TPA: chemotaxis protein CheB [Acidimicrobiales bacterium]|nr:chemotaxis protein CheB [Acidimicrobiales bacterium]
MAPSASDGGFAVVAIGCSWGGLHALSVVLEALPDDLPAAIVIVQHRLHAPSELASLLGQHTRWDVCEAEDKEGLAAGRVHLAPPGYHLLVDGDRFALSIDAPEHHSRPSVDVLFESMAESMGPRLIGVILTGANDDGAKGLEAVARHGGAAVVQDPETAEKRAMPDAAIAAVDGATVVPLEGLAGAIVELVAARSGIRS